MDARLAESPFGIHMMITAPRSPSRPYFCLLGIGGPHLRSERFFHRRCQKRHSLDEASDLDRHLLFPAATQDCEFRLLADGRLSHFVAEGRGILDLFALVADNTSSFLRPAFWAGPPFTTSAIRACLPMLPRGPPLPTRAWASHAYPEPAPFYLAVGDQGIRRMAGHFTRYCGRLPPDSSTPPLAWGRAGGQFKSNRPRFRRVFLNGRRFGPRRPYPGYSWPWPPRPPYRER